MRTDKLDERGFELEGEVDDKAILVTADVEDGPVISDEVYVVSESSSGPQVQSNRPLIRFGTKCRAVSRL